MSGNSKIALQADLGIYVPIQGLGEIEPLPCDRWLASSALQKAIRRADVLIAQKAARTLYRADRRSLWRRLLVIAFEDVGIGSIDAAMATASLAADAKMRRAVGGEEAAILAACRLLAEAPKDRSADLLMTAVVHDPGLEGVRRQCRSISVDALFDFVADASKPLAERAVAAWHGSGVELRGERRVGAGDFGGLMRAYARLGAPAKLLDAVAIAARRTRGPIAVFAPLLWLAAAKGETSVVDHPLPQSGSHCGAPLYALDMHTRLGRQAIHRFGQENVGIARFLNGQAPNNRNDAALRLAAFYADSAPVSRRLWWEQSEPLETIGIAADFHSVNVAAGVGAALIRLVGDNLAHLNAIRIRSLTREWFARRKAI